MAIQSLSDINAAIAAGRYHVQPFQKNAQGGSDGVWYDWSYIAGKPGYDARIGAVSSFNPFVAQRNDALYLPPIDASMERRLMGLTFSIIASGNNSTYFQAAMYDLLGVYPLIDGDSTDTQTMDNTQTLTRYTDGNGVQVALVCHVSPMLAAADGTMEYVDCQGNTLSTAFRVRAGTNGQVVSAIATGGGAGPIYLQLASGCRGVRRINSITWTTPPGGLVAAYLVKPLCENIVFRNHNTGATSYPAQDICLCREKAWHLPRIYDGAWLGFWFMSLAGSRTYSIFGNARMIWG